MPAPADFSLAIPAYQNINPQKAQQPPKTLTANQRCPLSVMRNLHYFSQIYKIKVYPVSLPCGKHAFCFLMGSSVLEFTPGSTHLLLSLPSVCAHLLWSLPSVCAYLLVCRGPGVSKKTVSILSKKTSC